MLKIFSQLLRGYDQGSIGKANRMLSLLRNRLDHLDYGNFDTDITYTYRMVAIHLLWAMTEIYAEIPDIGLTKIILANLRTALKNDFPDMVMMAVFLMGEQLMREKNFLEARNLWHYLWQSSRYMEHYHMMVKACCGLSECVLALNKKDKFVLEYMAEVEPYVRNIPASYGELLATRGMYHLLHKNFNMARPDIDQAEAITRKQGLRLLQLKTSGLRIIIEGDEENCLDLLFKESKQPRAKHVALPDTPQRGAFSLHPQDAGGCSRFELYFLNFNINCSSRRFWSSWY